MNLPELSFTDLSAGRLAYRRYGRADSMSIVILPGLFGSGDNWHRIAVSLSDIAQVWCLDLRNHGHSFHSVSMTYLEMAGDVNEFLAVHRLSNVCLVGHSMGGKVAMVSALSQCPAVSKLVIIDVMPKIYPKWHQSLLVLMCKTDLTLFNSRTELLAYLKAETGDVATSQFLMKNIQVTNEQLTWRIDVESIMNNYTAISEFPVQSWYSDIPALCLVGSDSHYVHHSDHLAALKLFPNMAWVFVSNAGHWVQADQPEHVVAEIRRFFEVVGNNP